MEHPTLEVYLSMDEDELLMQIAQLADPRAPLGSPGHLISKGSEVVEKNLARARAGICPRKDLIDTPEFELATVVLGLLVDHLTLGLASALAAYLAKRGVLWLCATVQEPAKVP